MPVLNDTISLNSCSGCGSSGCDAKSLTRLGVTADGCDYVVALAGNPNTGKSTVFNSLTGLRQHVGNWAGKTVSRAEGAFDFNDKKYKLVDLPGTYSLLSTSTDEEIARDFILFGKPDVTIVVVDATRLERNLNLALQIMEITDRVVIALNLIDEARRNNLTIDTRTLARDLGVPVVPMAARRGEGLSDLLETVEGIAEKSLATTPHHVKYADENLESAIAALTKQLNATFEDLPNARWVALRLLEGDESIIKSVREKTLGKQLTPNYHSQQFIQLEGKLNV